MESTEVREMINQAVQSQRRGEWEKGLELLGKSEKKTKFLAKDEAMSLLGLIWHYRGRIEQAMGEYKKAMRSLRRAASIRRGDPINRAYSLFQQFICADYGGIWLSPRKVREIKRALWEGIDTAKDPRFLGDAYQNLAYIESRQGDIEKAIWFYHVVEKFREIANDQRGFALTWARLGECYKKIGEEEKAREYGEKALNYFEEVGDPERIQQVKKNVLE
jgi:tetratricopeptide (TPR) repeat protein